MVDYKCEIEFISKNNSNINTITLPNGNNISQFNGGNYKDSSIEYIKRGSNPFIIGVSKIGDGSQYLNEYSGYLSSVLSDSNGDCNFEMTINGSAIDKIIIFFDNVVNEYATEIYIDDQVYENNSVYFIQEVANQSSHIVRFTKWNKANSNIRFTSITVGLSLTFNQFNGLLYYIRGSQSMQDNSLPEYGALSQYGNVKIADYTGLINQIEELGYLAQGIKIKLYLDDELVGDYLFDTFERENSTVYNIQLNDEIIKWNEIFVPGQLLKENATAYELYVLLKSYYQADYENLDDDIANYLTNIKIKYFYLESGSLFSQWNKFCDITQMLIFKKQNGKIAFRRLQ